jgi:hypothetical protein
MGFLSYCYSYYWDELEQLERTVPTHDSLYHACQLLRMLDDLRDEGYTELNEAVEKAFCGVSRLQNYLEQNGAKPFPQPPKYLSANDISYSAQDVELSDAIAKVMCSAAAIHETGPIPFANKLCRFCDWIGYEEKTAYIFLLRDTLLPFVYYSARGRNHIYPWLLGRKSFATLTGRPNADDEIRASIYKALENNCADSRAFFHFVLSDIQKTLDQYPQAKNTLSSMLADIPAEKVIVVESGCAGTFPLLLMSLDDRVDMRMYTTYPYLADIYKTRIFTSRYEENRVFETLVSQEMYFRFSRILNGSFYVQQCTNTAIEIQALSEIEVMQSGYRGRG